MGLFSSDAPEVEVTQAEIDLATQGAQKFNEHQENFVPLENSFISSLTPSVGDKARARGAAVSDIAQGAKALDQRIVRSSLGQAGQGKSVIERAKTSTDVGAARGAAAGEAEKSLRDREIAGKTKMAAFGRGLQDMNSVSLRSAASDATSRAMSKLSQSITDRGTTVSGIGTFAGTAIGNYDTMQALKNKDKPETV